jgi:hypothetical protein
MSIRFTKSLSAWGTPGFNDSLRDEIEQLNADLLPLQAGLSAGSHVLDKARRALVIAAAESAGAIRARVGIFYNSVIAGCSCADDPTPVDELNEYCEVTIDIDMTTAEAAVTLTPEPPD